MIICHKCKKKVTRGKIKQKTTLNFKKLLDFHVKILLKMNGFKVFQSMKVALYYLSESEPEYLPKNFVCLCVCVCILYSSSENKKEPKYIYFL